MEKEEEAHPTTPTTNFLQVPKRHELEMHSTASSNLELSSIGEEFTTTEHGKEQETTQNDSSISTIISCNCSDGAPTCTTHPDFTDEDDDYDELFNLDCMRASLDGIPANEKKYKNGTRKSLTFTNERMREIERENYILLQKIMSCSNGPSKSHFSYNTDATGSRKASAAVNRKKKQRQISLDNQILSRKLESIRRKKPSF